MSVIIPLKEDEINIITNGDMLLDNHIDKFSLILESCSNYRLCTTLMKYHPQLIESVPQNVKHIQLLHSGSRKKGHWVCSYYDTKSIYIYDSLNSRELNEDQLIFLKRLFPFYSFHQKGSVIFPPVQHQTNFTDCGVFAIAFCRSLLFELDPREENIQYNIPLMRNHLLSIYQTCRIEHFPTITQLPLLLSFNILRERSAKQKQDWVQLFHEKNEFISQTSSVVSNIQEDTLTNSVVTILPPATTSNRNGRKSQLNVTKLENTIIINGRKLTLNLVEKFHNI